MRTAKFKSEDEITTGRFLAALSNLLDAAQDEAEIAQEITKLPEEERTDFMIRAAEVCGTLGNMTSQVLIFVSRREAKSKLKQGRS